MPDVVESKKQAAQPAPKIKTEPPASTNGEEATPGEIGKKLNNWAVLSQLAYQGMTRKINGVWFSTHTSEWPRYYIVSLCSQPTILIVT